MGTFIRLVNYKNSGAKKKNFFNSEIKYIRDQNIFKNIPGEPIAYWLSGTLVDSFIKYDLIDEITHLKTGFTTGDNESFLRYWYELKKQLFLGEKEKLKWHPLNKGGGFRKWFGYNDFVVNWDNNGYEIKNNPGSTIRNEEYYFRSGITWSKLGGDLFSARYSMRNTLFDAVGLMCFPKKNEDLKFVLGFLCSKIAQYLMKMLNPTLSYTVGAVSKLPLKLGLNISQLKDIPYRNISISKSDWDLRETSWDFRRSPLLTDYSADQIETEIDENLTDVSWPSSFGKVAEINFAVESFKNFWKEQFLTLHKNEEELNKIFIELYGLEEELTPDVPYNEITILQEELDPKALKKNQIQYKDDEIIRQYISYAVGCIFGRYSLDVDGLVLANAGEGVGEYLKQVPEPSFMPDESGILPITEEDDFSDDLPSQFRNFLRVSFGEENFQENLRYIEDVLGKSIRDYLRNNFYKDHVQRYKKRPIYWMITSPSGALKALIYLHRYTKDTVNVFFKRLPAAF